MKKIILAFISAVSISAGMLQAQNVSISPSRIYYKTPVGESKVQEVTITNNATAKQSFNVTFGDFEPSGFSGKSQIMQAGESPNSCAKWLSCDPSYFEIEPGQTQKIKVLLQVPSSPESNKVKWAAMKVKLAKEKTGNNLSDDKAIGLGVTETFQFVVHIFQSPPSVTLKSAEIESFKDVTAPGDSSNVLLLKVKNSGEAILDCVSYLELTNLGNGTEERLKPFAYTLLPGAEREVKFTLSPSLGEGKYSVLGVVDFGSKENVQAAETEIQIKKK